MNEDDNARSAIVYITRALRILAADNEKHYDELRYLIDTAYDEACTSNQGE